jgi:hypothetical protein
MVGRQYGITVFYAGLEEKSRYLEALGALGISSAEAKFALLSSNYTEGSPGRNRNAVLLHSIDELVICCDDDSVCIPRSLRLGPQTVTTVEYGDLAITTQFVSDAHQGLQITPPNEHDLFSEHEELLGQSLQTLTDDNTLPSLAGQDRQDELLSKPNNSVFLTISGLIGDIAMPDCMKFLFSRGDLRNRFLAHWKLNGSLDSTRCVVRGVSRPTITRNAKVMTTTATGFDNRVLLPPFMPCGNGEDTLFGKVAQQSLPTNYVGQVPLGLLHVPAMRRHYRVSPRYTLAHMLMTLVGEASYPTSSESALRLQAIGLHLSGCSQDIHRCARRVGTHRIRRDLVLCDRYLNEFNSHPEYWADEVRRLRSEFEATMALPDGWMPADLLTSPAGSHLHSLSIFLHSMGCLMAEWPYIIAAARKLRQLGIRLGRPL